MQCHPMILNVVAVDAAAVRSAARTVARIRYGCAGHDEVASVGIVSMSTRCWKSQSFGVWVWAGDGKRIGILAELP